MRHRDSATFVIAAVPLPTESAAVTTILPIEETGANEYYPDLDTHELLHLVKFPFTKHSKKSPLKNTLLETAKGVVDLVAIPPILYTPQKPIPKPVFTLFKGKRSKGDFDLPREYILYKGLLFLMLICALGPLEGEWAQRVEYDMDDQGT